MQLSPYFCDPTVAKISEKIVHDQLYNYLNENKLLTSCQSGFRTLHSTLTALIETTNNWSVNIDDGVVFIDLQKAFDTIDHSILVRKLCNYGIDQTSLRWFRSYLSDRTQKCSVNHMATCLMLLQFLVASLKEVT